MIEFSHIKKTYKNGVNALNDISFHIGIGEFVFLIGESGAGKSTVLRLMLKETTPDYGKIFFHGQDITHVRKRRIPLIRKAIGVVFQDFRLLDDKNVYQNVAYAMQILGESSRSIKRKVPEVLEMVDLSARKKAFPHELSGGEKQRVCIARAMVTAPKLLIADEPTGNLDPDTSWGIVKTLERINAQQGTTILMITHAKEIVDRLQKRVIQLNDGVIVRDEERGKYSEKN